MVNMLALTMLAFNVRVSGLQQVTGDYLLTATLSPSSTQAAGRFSIIFDKPSALNGGKEAEAAYDLSFDSKGSPTLSMTRVNAAGGRCEIQKTRSCHHRESARGLLDVGGGVGWRKQSTSDLSVQQPAALGLC